ncbi:MAG: DUF1573 domain-containing protein [Bacteroidales bacterium]|nr:MAG: DUF1573 domain-containing protein [Bacteroidales bacterium]
MYRFSLAISTLVLFILFSCSSQPKVEPGVNASSEDSGVKKYPDLKLVEDFYDFGTIIQGEVVSHTFHFRNAGNDVLIVKDLIPDCGCTKPKIDKRTLNPGEESTVEVIFDSRGWYGSQYKSVALRTNSPIRDKSVTIKANVIEPKE